MTREEVIWAYRAFLGRLPESESVIEQKMGACDSLEALSRHFTSSEEFRGRLAPGVPLTWPPIRVDVEAAPPALEAIHAHVRDVWSRLGNSEPYWSVLSAQRFRAEQFDASRVEFFESGRSVVATLLNVLERNGIASDGLRTVNELGCGVGRVTRWLGDRFPRVLGCDASGSHIAIAREYLEGQGVRNVELRQLSVVADARALPRCDLAFSVIVLQHNPPPVMASLVASMLAWLNPGGVAFFQLPTYALGYSFDAEAYLASARPSDIEMHVLPQRHLFALIEQAGCRLLEIREDGWVGLPGWISNSVLVRRPA